MKKLIALVLFATLCLGCMCVAASAEETEYTADTWKDLELLGLFYQESDFINSDLAENYEAWWWDDYVEEVDDYLIAAYINMRGFAMSADGKYAYMGTLNGGTGVRGVVVLNTATGRVTDLYYKYDGENGLSGSAFSYAKGIDADDRGYVYTGFAFSNNYNLVNLGIAKQQENGELEEVYFGAVYENGEIPGDSSGVKVGVNGVEVAKIGDKYYCYVMTNYQYDALYCFDVTDPANPVLNKSFGIDGMIDFADADCTIDLDGKKLDEGQYMEVDADGTVWLCASLQGGGNGIIKIDASGITCQSYTEYAGAYCVSHYGDFIFVGLKDGTAVDVLDDSSMEKVAAIEVPDANRVTRIRIINDTLYVCGAGNDSMTYNYIYAAALTEEAQAAMDAQVAVLDKFQQSDASEEETTAEPDADTTTEQATTEAPADDETTKAPADDVTTEAPEEVTTEAPKTEKACGGIVGAGVMAIIALGVCAVIKKKD